MDKKLVLAIALSMLVLLTWSAIAPKPPQPPQVASPTEVASAKALPQSAIEKPVIPVLDLSNAPTSELATGQAKIIFTEPIAAIKDATFSAYASSLFYLKHGLFLADKGLVFKKETSQPGEIIFRSQDAHKRITKRFSFAPQHYQAELEIEIENLSSAPLKFDAPLVLGILDFSHDPNRSRFYDVVMSNLDKPQHFNGQKDLVVNKVKFAAIREQYFCLIAEPDIESTLVIKKITPKESEVSFIRDNLLIEPGKKAVEKFRIYLGPQDLQHISQANSAWGGIIHYGTFDLISQVIVQLLTFFYGWVHNWGLAIILLSLGIYLVLFPFSLKQMRSMKEMQILQPRIEELRKLYKDNPQKLNKEIMELYREHKVNPLSGCLPLLLQMPVFFALYQAMMRSVALKGATFLWIKDLSEPDRLFSLPSSLPLIGNEINILPIIMMIGMFLQQKISATPSTGSSAQQQKIMLIVFPLMFGFIFYKMPAGLVLYWLVNSMLMLVYQLKVNLAK